MTVLSAIQGADAELAEELRSESEYFERNAERMRYPTFRAQHLFVSLRVIEAGSKAGRCCNVRTVVLEAGRSRPISLHGFNFVIEVS